MGHVTQGGLGMAIAAMNAMPLIDADAHVTEQADVWTARVPKKFVEMVPRVDVHPKTGHHHWRIGDVWYWAVTGAATSQVGWPEHQPSTPMEYEDADPAVFDAAKRLERMDEYGIDAAILYPNLVGFASDAIIRLGSELSDLVVRAWNDYIWEWSSIDHARLVPMAMLPYWDIDKSVREMERCAGIGFRGVLAANKFEKIGLPSFVDPHWDPIYAAAEHMEIPINYHIGFGAFGDELREDGPRGERRRRSTDEERRALARISPSGLLANDDVLGILLTSGLCDRFPRLKLVSVEAGLGHIPFYLEALDWNWKIYGNTSQLPLLPSEYFRRQCFATYWFERTTLHSLDLYPDNFMFSTDFPHGGGIAPGPAAPTTLTPAEYATEAYAGIDPTVRAKALYQNACDVYGLDVGRLGGANTRAGTAGGTGERS